MKDHASIVTQPIIVTIVGKRTLAPIVTLTARMNELTFVIGAQTITRQPQEFDLSRSLKGSLS